MEVLIVLGCISGILLIIGISESKDDFSKVFGITLTSLMMFFLVLTVIPLYELRKLKDQVDSRHKADLYQAAYQLGKQDALNKKPYINQYHEQGKTQEEISGYSNGYAENYQ